jgi:hypothetical protein
VEALFGGELVRRETVRAMTARQSRMGPRAGYGLGVMIVRRGGTLVAEHDGLYFGWTASAGMDAGTGTTVAVVANVAGPTIPARRLAEAVRRRLPGTLATA